MHVSARDTHQHGTREATLGRGASVSCEVERLEGERLEGVFVRNDAVIWLGKERLPCYQGQAEGQEAYAEHPHPPGSATAQEARRRPYLLGLLEQRGQTIGGGGGAAGAGSVLAHATCAETWRDHHRK